jgi:3-oxoacyl-[acyl-carrier protein] reductase
MAKHTTEVAMVTGASRGIGREIALALARLGVAVGVTARDADALERVRRDCEAAGVRAASVAADVTRPAEVGAAVDRLRSALGPVDLLVNNAGRIESSEVPLWESDPDEWWAVVETDLRGPYLLSRAILPEMVDRGGGRIVNITTGAAVRDSAVYSAYGAAKTALLRLTGSIVVGAGEAGVRAFDVSPGTVETDMTGSMRMHRGRTTWTPVEAVTAVITAIASGRLDSLTGRYLRAGTDDIDDLVARADSIARDDARTLRLRAYGADDPLR